MRASPSGKASAFQADIHGFESRRPLSGFWWSDGSRQQPAARGRWPLLLRRAHSSTAEHLAHNRLVVGSNPTGPTLASQRCGALSLNLNLGADTQFVGEVICFSLSFILWKNIVFDRS